MIMNIIMDMNKLAFVMLLSISGMMTSCMADHKKLQI